MSTIKDGRTALMEAVLHGHAGIVEALAKRGSVTSKNSVRSGCLSASLVPLLTYAINVTTCRAGKQLHISRQSSGPIHKQRACWRRWLGETRASVFAAVTRCVVARALLARACS